jgi:hypothetical protein
MSLPSFHDGDAIADAQSFIEVMCNENNRFLDIGLQI